MQKFDCITCSFFKSTLWNNKICIPSCQKCLHTAMPWAAGPTQNGMKWGGTRSKQLFRCERVRAGALSAICAALKWGPWKARLTQTHTDANRHPPPFFFFTQSLTFSMIIFMYIKYRWRMFWFYKDGCSQKKFHAFGSVGCLGKKGNNKSLFS